MVKKNNYPIRKLRRQFTEEDIQAANECRKRCYIALAIEEMQMETTMRFHYTTTRMAVGGGAWGDSDRAKCW